MSLAAPVKNRVLHPGATSFHLVIVCLLSGDESYIVQWLHYVKGVFGNFFEE